MMKILFVADVSIQDELSGAERVLYEEATRLAARGHHVDILTRRLAHHDADRFVVAGVTEWRYPVDPSGPLPFLISTLRRGRHLFDHLNEAHPYHCINFHQPFSAFAVGLSRGTRLAGKVYTCHSLAHEEYLSRNVRPTSLLGRVGHRLHREGRRHIERWTLSASDRVVVLSTYTRDKLVQMHRIPPEKITVVPGGIDLDRFHPADNRDAIRERLDLPRNGMILLTVRGLEPRMGIGNLLRAVHDILPSVPHLLLVIGGSGPLRGELEALARGLGLGKHVQFRGFIPDALLPAYYQAADLFLLPTTELEGFGLVTLEALASGVPVLGTPVGGTREILGALDRNFLFADPSPRSMAEGIVRFCTLYRQNGEAWLADSRRCRAYVEATYSWERNVDATERLFASLGKAPFSR